MRRCHEGGRRLRAAIREHGHCFRQATRGGSRHAKDASRATAWLASVSGKVYRGDAWPPDGSDTVSGNPRAAGVAVCPRGWRATQSPRNAIGNAPGGQDWPLRGYGTASGRQRVARGHHASRGAWAANWSMKPCMKAPASDTRGSGRMGHASGKPRTADRDMPRTFREQPSNPRAPGGKACSGHALPSAGSALPLAGSALPRRGRAGSSRGRRGGPGTPCRRRAEAARSLEMASGLRQADNAWAAWAMREGAARQRGRSCHHAGRRAKAARGAPSACALPPEDRP